MNRTLALAILLFTLVPYIAIAESSENFCTEAAKTPPTKYRGWDRLVTRLKSDGVPSAAVTKVYKSSRMPLFKRVSFKLAPKEPKSIYTRFLTGKQLKIGARCLSSHLKTFKKAEIEHKVDRHVIAAILLIETHCGKTTGRSMILNRLSRLANIGEPRNICYNLTKLRKDDESVTIEQVQDRAAYLERTFYQEIPALFEIARINGINIFNIKGSFSGAFGIPQFLPTSYMRFGVDGNRDNRVSLFQMSDAIPSAAKFLAYHGWRDDSSLSEKRDVLWAYNRSDPYIDTVLKVASKLRG